MLERKRNSLLVERNIYRMSTTHGQRVLTRRLMGRVRYPQRSTPLLGEMLHFQRARYSLRRNR